MSKPRYQDLLYQVGSGLHSWSLVEMELARLFAAAADLRTNPHDVFGAVINFETRMAICDRLIAFAELEPVERVIWDKLSARLSKFYKKRHELAHFTLGSVESEEVIYPFLTTATMLVQNKPRLNAVQIKERVAKFAELREALGWFKRVVVRSRMPLQAPTLPPIEEPPLVARLRELATQTLEERERRASDPEG